MPAHDPHQSAATDLEPDAVVQPEGDSPTAQLAEMRERWMRSEAEIANVRMHARRDVDNARNFGMQKFANDMVEAAENLKRGLDSLPAATPDEPASLSGLRTGLVEIARGVVDILERNGVKMDDPTGAVFAPALHQAIGQRAVATQPAGTVVHALSPVWTLNGRLLRPAVVILATDPADAVPIDPKV